MANCHRHKSSPRCNQLLICLQSKPHTHESGPAIARAVVEWMGIFLFLTVVLSVIRLRLSYSFNQPHEKSDPQSPRTDPLVCWGFLSVHFNLTNQVHHRQQQQQQPSRKPPIITITSRYSSWRWQRCVRFGSVRLVSARLARVVLLELFVRAHSLQASSSFLLQWFGWWRWSGKTTDF